MNTIMKNLGPAGPGLLPVTGVPAAPDLRQTLLPMGQKLSLLNNEDRKRVLKVKPEEITAIMNEPGSLAPTDLYLGGTKYKVIQGEAGAVIRGKKGPGGVTVKKDHTMSFIIGVYDEPMTPDQCNMNVESLGDYIYLLEQGF